MIFKRDIGHYRLLDGMKETLVYRRIIDRIKPDMVQSYQTNNISWEEIKESGRCVCKNRGNNDLI